MNIETGFVEAVEGRSLPALISPVIRTSLLRMSRRERSSDRARRALRVLASFAGALKVKYNDLEVGIDEEPLHGLADHGDLERDLDDLLEAVGDAAFAADTVFALFIDELQNLQKQDLATLVMALHSCAQRESPVVLVGAGLPQLPGLLGKAKSYAERLFEFERIGALAPEDAALAIRAPAERENVQFTDRAISMIVANSQCYPYFLQEWGKHVWDIAVASPIDEGDVDAASVLVQAALDEGFYRVRFDGLTPSERIYLRAMAELGPGPHTSGDIAAQLGKTANQLSRRRDDLIKKGAIYSPSHGDTAFTVPLFDEFMKRTIRGDSWRNE